MNDLSLFRGMTHRCRYYFCCAILIVLISCCSCISDDNEKYLQEVDNAISMNERYISQKEHLINNLKANYVNAIDDDEGYNIMMDLYQNYQYYSLDSAFTYLDKAIELADKSNNPERITDVRISQAFLYNFSGMLAESLDIFRKIPVDSLSKNLRRNYYYLGFNLYNTLVNNAIDEDVASSYRDKMRSYRDSALAYSGGDIVLTAEKLNDAGKRDEAIAVLSKNLPDNLTTNEAGLRYYILSEIYAAKKDRDNQVKYLAMSSVAGINNGVRQYVALRKLAEIMYETNDIDRAYRYIHQCLDDAKACNSHSRILEAATILPIIDAAVMHQKQENKNNLIVTIFIITLLTLTLLCILVILKRKNRILNLSRLEQVTANEQLKALNSQLKNANVKLSALNSELVETQSMQSSLNNQLEESNRVKTEYITRFMNLCLEYISKMENYRKHLNKVANKRNFDLLYETIQSSRYITKEVADFYGNFDDAFLHIYPDFIRDINTLLKPDDQIVLKDDERLTTELRICALMKLGITDGTKIQKFLRCSASTVYNYRTNLRNKAIDRDSFEINISKL